MSEAKRIVRESPRLMRFPSVTASYGTFRQWICRGAEKATGNPLFVQKACSRPLRQKL